MIVVFDTNILVSSLFAPLGNEAHVLSLFLKRHILAAISPETLAEYDLVLSQPKFSFAAAGASELLRLMDVYAVRARPHSTLTISPDPTDNRFLECAEAAAADFLITGNKRHFPDHHGKTMIVNAREFLDAAASTR